MEWPETIRTDRLLLRRPVDSDATAIFDNYARDPDVVRHLTWRPHTTLADTQAFLAKCHDGWKTAVDLTWAITRHGDDSLIGMIGMRPRAHKCDIGYVLARPHWGQGLMTEAAQAIVEVAFTNPVVTRVWAVCDVDNRASARVMENAGMSYEGTLRRWIVHPNVSNEPRDALCYSLIRP